MKEENKTTLEWIKYVVLAILVLVVSLSVCIGLLYESAHVAIKVAAFAQLAIDGYVFYLLWKKIMNQNKK